MTEKILIIEDEDKIARFIELELSHEGYDVSKENNGRIKSKRPKAAAST